jgi:membrane protein implicated in regulation of membrane protease activity
MDQTTIWWLLAGGAIAVELLTGTFYLLMLAIGMACAALSAHFGAGLPAQFVVAAVVGGGAVVGWHLLKIKKTSKVSAGVNPAMNLDIGETVTVPHWNLDGTADVHYRGARWTVIHGAGVIPSSGVHRVAEVIGNRLLVEKV